ncbi:MAG: cytochrome c3 family protein, partial [Flavisolibacter sp.]
GGAWESKHAGIPSLNICMNCHKVISTYEKGPKIHDEEGNEVDGTAEIQKLYKYAGFTPGPGAQWDPSRGTSPVWIKIHNLPDHVYFNHAQHVRVGNVACQTCHGNIQEMDRVQQMAELSMGWCINCHRETKVNFNYNDSTGNKFYSIYEKFHNDIKAGKMDSVTVKDIGGTECQKCHY